jgi:zinc transporter ZupT
VSHVVDVVPSSPTRGLGFSYGANLKCEGPYARVTYRSQAAGSMATFSMNRCASSLGSSPIQSTAERWAPAVAVLVAFGSFFTTLLGGYAALRVGSYRFLVLGLAAGLMLGAVGFDLLPEALSPGFGCLFGIPIPLLAFVFGFLVLHVIEHTVGIHRGRASNDSDVSEAPSVGLLAASGLVGHSVMDGFAIGAAFQAGGRGGRGGRGGGDRP